MCKKQMSVVGLRSRWHNVIKIEKNLQDIFPEKVLLNPFVEFFWILTILFTRLISKFIPRIRRLNLH